MKPYLFFISAGVSLITLCNSSYAQTKPVATTANLATKSAEVTGAKINFDNTVHDFGIIPYNGPGTHVYVITNTGNEPLIIYNCVKGCGCTEVAWTKEPIMPGQKGMVRAAYNTKKIGDFSRGVDVYSNDQTNPKVNIRLKGSVEVVPGGEAPPIVNESKTTAKTASNEKW